MQPYKYVIIGNSAAGVAAVEGIRKRDRNGTIAIISQEDGGIYSRPMLSHFLSGKITEEKLNFRQEDFYSRNGAETFLGRCIAQVDPVKSCLRLTDGEEISFEKVMIATGAHAKRQEMPGCLLEERLLPAQQTGRPGDRGIGVLRDEGHNPGRRAGRDGGHPGIADQGPRCHVDYLLRQAHVAAVGR